MTLYQGSTPKYLLKLKDRENSQFDPSNISEIIEVLVQIYNALENTDIGKFYLNTSPAGSGWGKMDIKTIATGDKRILFALSAAQTGAAKGNQNLIQFNIVVPDEDCEGNTRTIIMKGTFNEIKSAKSA